jgi:hypothetical protein
MPRPHFDATLIGELRNRVVAHNQRTPSALAKLGHVKRIYEKAYSGPTPHERALAKVDAHLNDLAKAGEFDDAEHPRGAHGRFSRTAAAKPGVSIPLPATQDEHQKLQQTNAGYRALTTDLLPTRHNEIIGGVVRDVGSAAAGGLLVAGLLRGRPGGAVRRGARWIGGMAGKYGLGIPVSLTAHGLTAGAGVTRAAIARGRGRPAPPDPSHDLAARISEWFGAHGQRIGAATADLSMGAASAAARAAVHVAGSTARTPGQARLRRVGAAAALAAVPALAIRSKIEDTQLDPAVIGRNIDAYSYRSVQKLAGDPNAEDLLKASFLRYPYVGGVARAVRTGAAAVGGAAAGALAGFGIHAATGAGDHARGNPNHDARGRFTSRDAAVSGGALLGGAAAGLGVYAALRSHNTAQLSRALARSSTKLARKLAAVRSETGIGSVPKMIAERDARVREMMDEEPFASRLKDAGASLQEPSGEFRVVNAKAYTRAKVNDHLASKLSQIDEFAIPNEVSGASKSMRDLRAKARTHVDPDIVAKQKVLEFVASATPKEFHDALATVPDEKVRQEIGSIFDKRQEWINAVDDQIAAHHEAIAQAEAEVKKTSQRAADAQVAADKASAAHEAAEGKAKAAAKKRFDAADKAFDDADEAHQTAISRLDDLKKQPTGVRLPKELGGAAVPKPSREATERSRSSIIEAVRSDARKKADKEIADARDAQERDIVHRHSRAVAAHTHMTHSSGAAVPDQAAAEARAVAAASVAHEQARDALNTAHRNLIETQQRHDAHVSITPLPSQRKDHTAATKALKAQIKQHQADLKAAHAAVSTTSADVTGAVQAMERQMRVAAASTGGPRLPRQMIGDLRLEVMRAARAAASPVDAFIRSPSAAALKQFASSAIGLAGATAAATGEGIKETAKKAFLTEDGSALHPGKAIASIGVATAATDAILDHGAHIRRALFGSDEEKESAKPLKAPKGFRTEHKVHPITGAGYIAVHAPDPDNKGERLVVYGEHYKNDGSTTPLRAGSTLSDVRRAVADYEQKYQQQRPQNQNAPSSSTIGGATSGPRELRDAQNLEPNRKALIDKTVAALKGTQGGLQTLRAGQDGPEMQFRGDGSNDKEHNDAAGQFVAHLRDKHLASGAPQGQAVHKALDTLFSNEGRVLTRKQAFAQLTGYTKEGQDRNKPSILTKRPGFGSADKAEVGAALNAEIDRIVKDAAPRDDREKGALHLAASVIGVEKQLPDDVMQAVHAKIRGSTPTTGPAETAGASSSGIAAPKAQPAGPIAKEPDSTDPDKLVENENPPHFVASQLRDYAEGEARALRTDLRLRQADQAEILIPAIEHLARVVGHSHGLDEQTAARVAADTFRATAAGGDWNRVMTADEIAKGNLNTFRYTLRRKADAEKLKMEANKSAGAVPLGKLLDDLDALAKAFDGGDFNPDLHPRLAAGEQGGGEFAPKGGHGAGGLAGRIRQGAVEGSTDIVDKQAAAAARGTSRKAVPWYSPGRAIPDAGNALGGAFAYAGAEKAMQIAERFLPAPLRTAAEVASAPGLVGGVKAALGLGFKGAIKEGAKAAAKTGLVGGASVAGGTLGALVGTKLVGHEAPAPAYHDSGEALAESAGSLAGSFAGSAAALVPGPGWLVAPTLSAAGSYAGGLVARGAYDWFKGYDQKTVARVARRYAKPATNP